ncbi:hypothetical protein NGRA_1182 [Nosema granulosis]|uniref:SMP-LTD domain-containing protein n=1 Tax=Nosema granulosis TaxID=83296 RepID=A0A9P6GZF3_9MICR|nr:hypothetical protein NGRA_1182 [Nosema granulosis]
MILEFFLGLAIGILTIPLILILLPGSSWGLVSKHKNKPFKLSANQTSMIRKSLHVCTDLHWLNVLISRFWHEIADSQAQAYRIKSYISKYFEVFSNTGIIKNIVIDDVFIDKEAPIVESIRVLSNEECAKILSSGGVVKDSNNILPNEETLLNEEIFRNVNTLLKIDYEGSIRINMRIDLFNKFSFRLDVFVRKIKGDILMRLPSLDYNTRLEYTFVKTPEIEISIEAGVSRNEGKAYFKDSISNFVRRSIKYTILRLFVYPSFSTLVLPLVVPAFKKHDHKIEKISVETCEDSLSHIKDTLSLFLSMDYKIVEVFEGITVRRNNYLINEVDKVTCTHFPIPENNPLETSKNYIYEGLSIKESKFMNLIYDLSILKDVVSSFRGAHTVHNFNQTSSLVEIFLNKTPLEYIRIVSRDTIYFQRNDVDNPEFLIFRISNKEIYIYTFGSSINFTKKRILKLLKKFDGQASTVGSLYKVGTLYKVASLYNFFKKSTKYAYTNNYVEDVSSLTVEEEQPALLKVFEKYTCRNLLGLEKYYFFDASPTLILRTLSEEIRLRLVAENTKIFRSKEYSKYKSLAIENCDQDGEDFIMHTYTTGNKIMDIINGKKILFVVEEDATVNNKVSLYTNRNPDIGLYTGNNDTRNTIDSNKIRNTKEKKINFNSKRSRLNIFVEEGFKITFKNYFLESIHTRLRQQEFFDITEKRDYEQVEMSKETRRDEIRRDFYGDRGGVYIEFKTQVPDDFRFVLHSSAQKKNVLDIQKVITTKPFKMVLPIYEADILAMKLFPKYKKNDFVELKIVNLPVSFTKESLIDCNIGLGSNQKFSFPTMGSQNFIIFWEKENDSSISGIIESPITQVPITGNGSIRTDNMKYSIIYKNKGKKKRNIKIYMGSTMKE